MLSRWQADRVPPLHNSCHMARSGLHRLTPRPSDTKIIEPRRDHAFDIIKISAIEDKWTFHQLAQFFHIEQLELAPLGDDHQGIGLLSRLIGTLAIGDVGEDAPGILHRSGVVGFNVYTGAE